MVPSVNMRVAAARPILSILIGFIFMFLASATSTSSAWGQNSYRVVTKVSEKIAPGNVAFVDTVGKRIVEIDRAGKIVWKWSFSGKLIGRGNLRSGADLEWIAADDSFLLVIPFRGIFRVSRAGKIIWRHVTNKVSHDADLLPNGNVLYVFGWDAPSDAQVYEVDPRGEIVWSWKARDKIDEFKRRPVKSEPRPSYAHTNAAVRLAGGDTIVSLRNFNRVFRVAPSGYVTRTWGRIPRVHEPNLLPDGTLVASPHRRNKNSVIAISNHGEKRTVFSNALGIRPIRTVEILDNGNYLLTGGEEIVEIDPLGLVVWHVVIYPKGERRRRANSRRSVGDRRGRRREGRRRQGRDVGGKRRGGGPGGTKGVYKAVWVGR